MNRRELIRRSFSAAALLAAGRWSLAAEEKKAEKKKENVSADLITAAAEKSVRRGLAYLAARQRDDGAMGSSGYATNTGVCALAGMAFMSGGSTPGRGPYGKQVKRCIAYLIANCDDGGFIHAGDRTHGPMYGHGFATMFLAECYGMSARADLRDKLAKAVKLIMAKQSKEGGWRYQPAPDEADISVTVCQVMALRAARNAGLHVPAETIDRAVEYVKRCQNPDGGFMYQAHGGQSVFPRSAAAVVALYSAGVYEGPELERGLKYLAAHSPGEAAPRRQAHYYYGQYYAVQAMWQAGGDHWRRWYPAVRDELVALQQDDGSWWDGIGSEYGTAMAAIVLQMPNNYLPIFQR